MTLVAESRPLLAGWAIAVPGADERKLAKSTSLKADSIVLDLEDGVALNRKGAAREMVYTALESSTFAPGTERVVRINAVGSGFELDDLNVVLRSKKIDAIVIPKVDTAQHVQFVSRLIDLVAEPETCATVVVVGGPRHLRAAYRRFSFLSRAVRVAFVYWQPSSPPSAS